MSDVIKHAMNKLNQLEEDQTTKEQKEFAKSMSDMLLEFVSDDDYIDYTCPSKEQYKFAEEVRQLIQELVDLENNEDLEEEFTSKHSLYSHFKKHCLNSDQTKQSSLKNVYYDFNDVTEYGKLEAKLINKFKSWDTPKLTTLTNSSEVEEKFKELFRGDRYLVITPFCGVHNQFGYIAVGLHAYSNNYTKNYVGKTIDLAILTEQASTVTLYPIDANYLETKLNNILKNHSNIDVKLKFNFE